MPIEAGRIQSEIAMNDGCPHDIVPIAVSSGFASLGAGPANSDFVSVRPGWPSGKNVSKN